MIRKLIRSVREYKRDTFLTPVFVILEVIMEIIIPLLMARMIDEGITGQDSQVLTSLGTILIICVLVGLAAGVLSGAFCAKASGGFAQNLRQDMYDKIQEYSFANIDKIFHIQYCDPSHNRCDECAERFYDDHPCSCPGRPLCWCFP